MNLVLRRANKIIFISLLFIAAFSHISCITAGKKGNQPYIWLTNSSKFILLPTKDIEKPLDGLQRISASYSGQEFQINTWVKADGTGMDITLLNEMGSNMGEMLYTDGKVSFSSALFPASLKPEYIIADFQFCFYNADALSQALEKSGLSLITNNEAGKKTRHIKKGDALIIEITQNFNYISLINHLRGYTYILEGDFQ